MIANTPSYAAPVLSLKAIPETSQPPVRFNATPYGEEYDIRMSEDILFFSRARWPRSLPTNLSRGLKTLPSSSLNALRDAAVPCALT